MRGKKSVLRKRTYKKRVYKKKPIVSKTVKNYVKREFARQVENKTITSTLTQFAFGNIVESPDMNMYPILPYAGFLTLPAGVTQGTRVGNQCKVKSVMLNYVINPLQYNATTNLNPQPLIIMCFLGSVKATRGILPSSTDLTFLYQLGGTSVQPSGTTSDLLFDINTDYWDIKKKWTHKIGYANNAGTGNSAANQSFANNDFKYSVVRKMNITRYCDKVMKFNDSSPTHQGRNLFFFYQAVSATGILLGSAATNQSANMNHFINIVYEDA